MNNLDSIWDDVIRNGSDNHSMLVDQLTSSQSLAEFAGSKHFSLLKLVSSLIRREMTVLDFGCDKGQMVLYLRSLGFDSYGVDIPSEQRNWAPVRKIWRLIYEEDAPLSVYDGVTVPFTDKKFDLILSQQVLEHVKDPGLYFLLINKMLNPGGVAILEFPHKYIPYDGHTKLWFIHWLPDSFRDKWYDLFSKYDSNYYREMLNFQSCLYYSQILESLGFRIENLTIGRLERFDISNYEGPKNIRALVHMLSRAPVFGKFVYRLVSMFCIQTWLIRRIND